MDEVVTKRDAIGAVNDVLAEYISTFKPWQEKIPLECALKITALPPVQPKIIHCEDCKHWNLQVGNVKGDGLGSCDFHNVNLVTGEGFCYWADKRGEVDG